MLDIHHTKAVQVRNSANVEYRVHVNSFVEGWGGEGHANVLRK